MTNISEAIWLLLVHTFLYRCLMTYGIRPFVKYNVAD